MIDAQSALDATKSLRQEPRLLIDGELVLASDGATFTTINPATGQPLSTVPNAGAADVDKAVRAARKAQKQWGRLDYSARRTAVLELARILRENADLLGQLDTLDTGNIYSAMRTDAYGAADMIEYYAAVGFEIKGEVTHLDRDLHYTRREPFGVVARLLPFNHPIASLGTAIAAPLLTGNCVVMKPSPHTPLSALTFAKLVKDLLPPGVLNIVVGDNMRASAPLVQHPGVDRIALIGSVEAGKAVMHAAADRLVPLTLELGGKNPLIIYPDFDPEAAADIAVRGMNFGWQSHSCASTSRIMVHKSIEKQFLESLAEKVSRIRVADPFSEEAEMGAISTRELYDRSLRYIGSAKTQGAKLLSGGTVPSDKALQDGLFLTPSVFGDVEPHMDIAREEIFGPVIGVMSWDDPEKMLEVANELPFGLTTVILTNDLNAAHRTAEAVSVGYVEINGPVSFALGSPYGGIKQSGFGREGCSEELLGYLRTKSINVRLAERFR